MKKTNNEKPNVKAGDVIIFKIEGEPQYDNEFTVKSVNAKSISYWYSRIFKANVNNMSVGVMSFGQFNRGIASGTYTIKK